MKNLKRINGSVFLAITFLLFMLSNSVAEDAAAQEAVSEQANLTQETSKPESLPVSEEPSAQTLQKLPLEERLSMPVSLDLRNMDIVDALKYLSTKGALNIVSSKNVSGRVTFTLDNVALKDAFDLMLRLNGLAYVKEGDIFSVMTEAEYKTMYGKNFFDTRQVKVLRLKYSIPELTFTMLDALKSEIGRVLVDPESGNVLIMDTPHHIERIESALDEWEKQSTVEVFDLKYAKAKEVEEILKTRLDVKKVGSVKADERNNQVIVQTLPERMDEIARLIASLDKQTKEVLIDAKIIKIKLSDQLDSGIEWEGIFNAADKNGLTYVGSYPFSAVQSATAAFRTRQQVLNDLGGQVGSYPFSGTTSNLAASTKVSPGEKINVGIVDTNKDVDFLFKILQTLGESRVMANPKLVVINNQEAKIHIGERQAYVTTTTTTGQTTSTISEEVTFVDVGIQLAVTPNINDDGYITMKVRPEISSVSSVLITPTNNRIPIIDTSMAETTVLMKDGTTLIIGGLRKEDTTGSAEQFPILGKIPLLKFFFRSGQSKVERTELLVLLTPHIISGNELVPGGKRAFGDKPGKEYQEYQPITPDKEMLPQQAPGIAPKSSSEPMSLKGIKDKDISIKEAKYEQP